ncbi:MAG: gliding motility-associated C-terminal domain-containing protein [Flavobacteriales bacterium]
MIYKLLSSALIVGFLSVGQFAFSQVANGSFESNLGLPSNTGEWSLVNDWSNSGSTSSSPDYYHTNGTYGGDLPETPIAFVNPQDGNAVMGFAATGQKGTSYREYLSNKLMQPLTTGSKYVVSFYITNGQRIAGSSSGLGASHMGIYLSSSTPNQIGTSPLHVTPQFEKQTPLYSNTWTRISFAFIADQDFEHLTIGVFGDDADKQMIKFEGSSPSISYYFIDNFKIEEVSQEITISYDNTKGPTPKVESEDEDLPDFFVPNTFTPNGDGENDVFLPIAPNNEDFTLNIYNRWGEMVFTTDDPKMGWNGHCGGGECVAQDTYIWEIGYVGIAENELSVEKVIRGTVNLIK